MRQETNTRSGYLARDVCHLDRIRGVVTIDKVNCSLDTAFTLYCLANDLESFRLVLLFHWPVTVSVAQYTAILHYINLPTK